MNAQYTLDNTSILVKRERRAATLLHLLPVCLVLATLLGCKNNSTQNTKPGPPWVTFNKSNHQLVNDHVNSLYTDAEGIVWVATDSGASFFNRGSWSSFTDQLSYTTYSNSGSSTSSTVTCITEGQDRSIWFGLYGGGVARYNQFAQLSVWKYYTASNGGIPWDVVTGLDRGYTSGSGVAGDIWCATSYGVGHFVPTTNEGGVWMDYYTNVNSTLASNLVSAIAVNTPNSDYHIWFACAYPSAVVSVDPSGQNWQQSIPVPDGLTVVSIAFDIHNTAWFAKQGGVSSLNTKTFVWTNYTNASTGGKLPPGNVNVVTTDYDVTRWFGTNTGLARLVDTTWTTFSSTTGAPLPNDTVTALTIDINKNLWIGTPHGVAVFNEAGTRF